jgi:glycerol uptake facilitator-like aquaporin
MSLGRKMAAEAIGTMLLLTAVVGSGIMGDRLSGGNPALALLANSIATGAALIAIILAFGGISGAHLNPVVTLASASQRRMELGEAGGYVLAQLAGAFTGVAAAHAMFNEPLFAFSTHVRAGTTQMFSEFLATFGLLSVIWGCSRYHARMVPFAVGAYIAGAYWFTSSTSFANPAVTAARAFTNTFSGIRPADAPAFVVAQIVGAFAATVFWSWLFAGSKGETQ